ncbi:hypothetical protein AX15_001402 [Amanita polypyramis BW_CC]|nr:hypothetical protein AX15_001402 [Amanita polypyramis BW_CC]
MRMGGRERKRPDVSGWHTLLGCSDKVKLFQFHRSLLEVEFGVYTLGACRCRQADSMDPGQKEDVPRAESVISWPRLFTIETKPYIVCVDKKLKDDVIAPT